MFEAVRAEALKLRRHRATWLMVWIFPIAVTAIVFFQILRDMFGQVVEAPITSAAWLAESAKIWSFPLDGGGRFIIAGFAALVFGGEYGWNTWKLIIPARDRWQLISAKWIVSSAFILLAFAAADLIAISGSSLRGPLGGIGIPDGVTIGSLVNVHASSAGHAVVPILYTIAWAALFAVLTTSVLATVVLSFGMVLSEQLLLAGAPLAHDIAPSLTSMLLQVLPFYHMANLIAWAKGVGLTLPLGTSESLTTTWATSLAIVVIWIGAIGATTLLRFSRQDLN